MRNSKEEGEAEQSKRKETDGTETRDNVSLSPQQSLNFADMMSLCDQVRAVSCCLVPCCADRSVGERTNNLSPGLALNPNGAPQQALPLVSGRAGWPPAPDPCEAEPKAVQGSPGLIPSQAHRRELDPIEPGQVAVA